MMSLVEIFRRALSCGRYIPQSTLFFFLALLATGLCPAWIELLFHLTPDPGHGELERILVVLIAAIALLRVRARRRRLSRSVSDV